MLPPEDIARMIRRYNYNDVMITMTSLFCAVSQPQDCAELGGNNTAKRMKIDRRVATGGLGVPGPPCCGRCPST